MFKKIIKFSLLAACLLISSLSAFTQPTPLPEEFTVTERWLSLTTTFDINSKNQYLGTVHRKFFSWSPEYHLLDAHENLLATARMRFFSLLTVFDIKDYNSQPLGMIKEEVTWFYPTFTIISPNHYLLGEAVMNFWGTQFTILHPFDGHEIATISRPFFRLKSNWKITIHDMASISANNIHPHLLMTLAAFQVDREYWNTYRASVQTYDTYDNYYDVKGEDSESANIQNTLETDIVSAESIRKQFQVKLEAYSDQYSEKEVQEEDLLFIESMQIQALNCAPETDNLVKLENTLSELFTHFTSDTLNENQKVALFVMLNNKLN